jgi:hypothetical protein
MILIPKKALSIEIVLRLVMDKVLVVTPTYRKGYGYGEG